MSRARWIFALVALTFVVACSDYSTGVNVPGTLHLQLHTPNADDGAVLFEVSGPSITSVTLGNEPVELFTRQSDGGTIEGAIVGTVVNGTVAVLHVPYGATAAAYSARVLEVADRGDALRASVGAYSLTVEP
jgi:hypothetical protein